MKTSQQSSTADESVAFHSAPNATCPLLSLTPVRQCLHPFLSDEDAARLMRASRSITETLLSGYAFVDHAFTFYSRALADVKCCIDLYARYHMRIVRMCLPRGWNRPLVDDSTGQSLLPLSLVCLAIGFDCGEENVARSAAYAPLDGSADKRHVAGTVTDSSGRQDRGSEREGDDREFWRLFRSMEWGSHIWHYSDCLGAFNKPIPPGALPHGLRFLQLSGEFNQPLQVGSIPDTVEVLQFGVSFDQLLEEGQLPASLEYLLLGFLHNQPLLPGVLPAGLKRLSLAVHYNQLLQPGTLPPRLQQLALGELYKLPLNPGVIPPSVTRLRLSRHFNQPLQVGSIPYGVEYLNLGSRFDQTLSPGVLPRSLRQLVVSLELEHDLLPGSLPDGLEVLAFDGRSLFQQSLQPGIIPSELIALSMGDTYAAKLVAGGIPATVRWLRLPVRYRKADLSAVLAPATRLVWSLTPLTDAA